MKVVAGIQIQMAGEGVQVSIRVTVAMMILNHCDQEARDHLWQILQRMILLQGISYK